MQIGGHLDTFSGPEEVLLLIYGYIAIGYSTSYTHQLEHMIYGVIERSKICPLVVEVLQFELLVVVGVIQLYFNFFQAKERVF